MVTITEAPPASTAPAAARQGRPGLTVLLVLWFLLGAGLMGVLVFGGFDGRPVEDLSALNPIKHHTYFGPACLVWTALSAIGLPRTFMAIFGRD